MPKEANVEEGVGSGLRKERPQHLLIVLFCLFETLLLASVVMFFVVDGRRGPSAIEAAAGVTYGFSFVGQLIVCFLLRRRARPLAVIGWLSLLGSILAGMFLPAIA